MCLYTLNLWINQDRLIKHPKISKCVIKSSENAIYAGAYFKFDKRWICCYIRQNADFITRLNTDSLFKSISPGVFAWWLWLPLSEFSSVFLSKNKYFLQTLIFIIFISSFSFYLYDLLPWRVLLVFMGGSWGLRQGASWSRSCHKVIWTWPCIKSNLYLPPH